MTELVAATTQHLAAQIGQAWLDAYHADPEEPRRSEHFERLQDLVDEQMLSPGTRLDDLVEGAYAWIRNSHTNATESAMDFVRAVLPHFECITSVDGEPQEAFLLAIPMIGLPSEAARIASAASDMELEGALIEAGVLPKQSRTMWLPRPVSVHEAGNWMADTRHVLLSAAIEGVPLTEILANPQTRFGADRVSLSILVGVCVCPKEVSDLAHQDPAFLHADPTEFFDEVENSDEQAMWALNRRDNAGREAMIQLNQRLQAAGFVGSRLETADSLAGALSNVIAWSIATQQGQEASLLGVTPEQRAEWGQKAHHRLGMDIATDTLTFLSEYEGKILGPFTTDFPWRNLSVEEVCQSLNQMGLIGPSDNVQFFADAQALWNASRPTVQRHRLN